MEGSASTEEEEEEEARAVTAREWEEEGEAEGEKVMVGRPFLRSQRANLSRAGARRWRPEGS